MLPAVIISCLVPVGLLVVAADGGGLPTVVIAFTALVLITAALMRSIGRAIDQQPDARSVPPSAP